MSRLAAFSAYAALTAALLDSTSAVAQRADDNAIADAEDAFGSNVGGESLGVYGPSDVRGFSPTDAGNVRIEGLYLDRQAELTSRLVKGNRIRVGPSALGYAFPAPSGIADYRLRKPGDRAILSLVAQADSLGASLVEADALLPLHGARLGLAGGVGVYNNDYPFGGTARVLSTAVLGVWRPNPGTEVTPFWSRIRIVDEEAEPVILGNGQGLPARLPRHRFLGQDWADFEVERLNYGLIGRTRVAGFTLRAGAFRSADITREGYTLLVDGADRTGTPTDRSVIADPYRSRASTSGEITVARRLDAGRVEHDLLVSLRARRQDRRYGGAARRELAPAPYGESLPVARPDFAFSAQTEDQVRQETLGFAYQGQIDDRGRVSIGVQRTQYRKRVARPSKLLPESRATPWLFNGAGSLRMGQAVSLYGGFAEGLEESDVAPETARNRDEAPPAIRTRQIDAGLVWHAGDRTTLIVGAFEITKPYYGLDAARQFRDLGEVRHRGLEASLTGAPLPGLTYVLGGVLLEARLSGEEVASGLIGSRPVGTPSRKLISSVDWRAPFHDRLSLDLSIEHLGRQAGDVANRVSIPARTLVDVGARYRFEVGRAPAVLRLEIGNLFDAYGWDSAGSNAFTYIAPRQARLRLSVDL